MRLKNEITVGVVVVIAILATVLGAIWLSGRPWGEEQLEVVGVFREVGELRAGNPVKFRGVQVGRVTEIRLSEQGLGVLVAMEVSPDLVVPDDAGVLLAPASLFGDWQASIVSRAAYPELEFTGANSPEVLDGATLPDITQLTAVGAQIAENLQTLAGRVEIAFTEETAIKMRQTIENVQLMSEQLTGFVDQQTQTYRDVSQNVLVAAQDISRVAEDVESAFTEGGQIQEVLANVEQASANLEQLSIRLETATAGVPALVARADTTLNALGRLAGSSATLLATLEPQVQEVGPAIAEARVALSSLQRVTQQLENGDGTLGRLLEDPLLYEELQATVAAMRRTLADIQANPARYIGALRLF
jgi:phospholipid/cholesterol/gamma-HCH transport system substrate-binding protein